MDEMPKIFAQVITMQRKNKVGMDLECNETEADL
jgi:hypothetical protein